MSHPFTVDTPALQQAISHCLLKDQFYLRRDAKRIDNATALEKLLNKISASQAIVQSRIIPLSLEYPEQLPVSAKRTEILAAIKNHQVVVIAGETGSGKTTQLPKICLEAGLGQKGRIGHTQPRRLAARSVATRIAEELKVKLGEQVGFQVRFSDQSQDSTRIKLMTDGILLAQTQHDRFLNEYDCLIIDEAHERSLNIDFLLGYLKQLLPKRPDLKVIITSATIDLERFSKHFDNAPVIQVSGRTYPVEMRYRTLLSEGDEEDLSLLEGISSALAELREEDRKQGQLGDVLVFLPGEREIRECAEQLRKEQIPATEILPLYARLGVADQQKIFNPQGGRRVILATNVAETSLTVPRIRYVVDSGLARISRYSYRSKVQRLPIESISKASANQRAGRCGRLSAGICIRLFDEQDYLNRPEFTEPEIQRTNLAAVILQMLQLRLGDIAKFPFVDAPDSRFIKDGLGLLQELQAVDGQQELTELGRQMAKLSVDPRLARMLLEGHLRGSLNEVLIISAALSVQDPRERPADKQQAANEKHRIWADEESDFASLINLWHGLEEQRQALTQNQLRKWCQKHYLSYLRYREWRDTHHQLKLQCKELGLQFNEQAASYEPLHRALLAGMLSQVGFKAEGQEYLGARNRKFLLYPSSVLYKKKPKWIMAAELVETSQLYARTVARIEPMWLEEQAKSLLKYQYFEPHWERQRGQVVAFEQSSLYGLTINPKKPVNFADIEPETARTIFIAEALVAQQLNSKKLKFYQRNIDTLLEVTELEEKSRRRDLVIDEKWQANFYSQHLPPKFVSQKHLESWYEKAATNQRQTLEFTPEQLLSPEASGIGVSDFPAELQWQGMAFPLSYSFAPGNQDDGVSLTVPLAMLNQVPAERIEWLVPGFIADKVAAIIKALDKPIRKQFVPVPNTAAAFLQQASPAQGSLYGQLLAFLNRTLRPALDLESLQAGNLEAHYLMNIKVLDSRGKLLAQGRDLAALKQTWAGQVQAQAVTLSHGDYQQSKLSSWSFGDLPDSVQSTVHGLPVRSFPCLKVNKNKEIELTVEAKQQAAQRAHRAGVVALVRKQLPELERTLKLSISKYMQPHWLLAKGMANQNELIEQLVEASFLQIFAPLDEALPRQMQEFKARLERRSELMAHGEQLRAEFLGWLKLRHSILKAMTGAISLDKAMAFSDAKAHLQRLFATGFMVSAPWSQLKQYARYLKGIEYRLDKLQGNLMRDRQSMIEFDSLWLPYQERLKVLGDEVTPELIEFGWLLEEWRVGLFAQPLGTAEPVSLKRLEKRWQEIKH